MLRRLTLFPAATVRSGRRRPNTISRGGYLAAFLFPATWKTVFKDVVDGLIYGLITGALFAWLVATDTGG